MTYGFELKHQNCLCDLRKVSNSVWSVSVGLCGMWSVTVLCAALKIGPCVSFCVCISTVYSTHTGYSDSETKFSLRWNVELCTATRTFTTKLSCISQLIHLCRSTAFWIWEFSTTTLTMVTLPMFKKTYLMTFHFLFSFLGIFFEFPYFLLHHCL